jgi:hypothetical protein
VFFLVPKADTRTSLVILVFCKVFANLWIWIAFESWMHDASVCIRLPWLFTSQFRRVLLECGYVYRPSQMANRGACFCSTSCSFVVAHWYSKSSCISDPKRFLIAALGATRGGKTKRSHLVFAKGRKLVDKKIRARSSDRYVAVQFTEYSRIFLKTISSCFLHLSPTLTLKFIKSVQERSSLALSFDDSAEPTRALLSCVVFREYETNLHRDFLYLYLLLICFPFLFLGNIIGDPAFLLQVS